MDGRERERGRTMLSTPLDLNWSYSVTYGGRWFSGCAKGEEERECQEAALPE